MTTLAVNTDKLLTAADTIRTSVTTSDLQHHFPSVQPGNVVAWMRLMMFTAAAGGFAEEVSTELAVVANAITLGANDADEADASLGRRT